MRYSPIDSRLALAAAITSILFAASASASASANANAADRGCLAVLISGLNCRCRGSRPP
jgi:hypothetical protein